MGERAIRPARADDLPAVYDIFYENEVGDMPDPPPRGPALLLRHELATGTMLVGEDRGQPVAFAALFVRDGVAFLAELFVRRRAQSAGWGTRLLRRILPPDARVRCTVSSTDPRALALYIRAGMQPRWPHFWLRADAAALGPLPTTGLEVVAADPADRALAAWDAETGGRRRSGDLAYWVREERAAPLWFRRAGATVGYGFVRLGAGTLWYPEAAQVGPIGARTPEDAAACALAAVAWARSRAAVLHLSVPGPHPGLAPLLDAHFRITYVETFLSSAATPFFDPRRYLTSGSELF